MNVWLSQALDIRPQKHHTYEPGIAPIDAHVMAQDYATPIERYLAPGMDIPLRLSISGPAIRTLYRRS